MVGIVALWLPILLSAVFVFVASSILHMVLPIHRRDYEKLPGEDNVLEGMRKEHVVQIRVRRAGLRPGHRRHLRPALAELTRLPFMSSLPGVRLL